MALHKAWEDIPREELSRKIKRRIVTGEKVMTAIVDLAEGAVVPSHQHDSEQITYVVSGWLRFTMGDGSVIDVKSGETLVIPSNVEHAAVAMEDTVALVLGARSKGERRDSAYLAVASTVIRRAIESEPPTVILYQAGMDPYDVDGVTAAALRVRDAWVFAAAPMTYSVQSPRPPGEPSFSYHSIRLSP